MKTSVTQESLLSLAKEVLDVEASALLAARDRIGTSFLDATRILLARESGARIVVMGMGKSGHVGRKLAATLASTGSPAMFVHPAEAGHGDLGMITQNDVVVVISQSGKSEEILRIVPYLKRNRVRIVAMTADARSPLGAHADAVIDTAVDREACPLGLAPTTSTTLCMALGDALAMCLLKARGFTSDKFAETHPHGTLGRRLLVSVAEVMVTGADVPITAAEVTIRDALVVMSQAGLGFVNVLDGAGKIIGIFTDGDLRRALDRDVDIKTQRLGAVMSSKFVSVRPDRLAVEAVDLMERYKVSAMPVIDEAECLVGAINMRMLLQAGVV